LCHGAIEPWKTSRVLHNEYVTWSHSDKHARAFAVLRNARSKEIAHRLGLKDPPHRSPMCLDCHAHNVALDRRGERYVVSDGVTCEACHGPAERWIRSHVEEGATHAQNLANGMYPTSDDVERARLCLSCHFGNVRKIVTHKMMAAGHPRMSFELDTFMQIQPPHFRVGAAGRSGSDGVRTWAVGQALAAYSLLDILNDPRRGHDGFFPELMLFDCHACHHYMGEKRDSAARVAAGPGIVRLNDASLLMLRQIARYVNATGEPQFWAQVNLLHRAIATRDDTLIQSRATQALVMQLVPRIQNHVFSKNDLRGMLIGLIDDGLAGQYTDYQGAEQAVMAAQSIADLMARRGMLHAAAVESAMTGLLSAVASDEQYRPVGFQQALRALRAQFEVREVR